MTKFKDSKGKLGSSNKLSSRASLDFEVTDPQWDLSTNIFQEARQEL